VTFTKLIKMLSDVQLDLCQLKQDNEHYEESCRLFYKKYKKCMHAKPLIIVRESGLETCTVCNRTIDPKNETWDMDQLSLFETNQS